MLTYRLRAAAGKVARRVRAILPGGDGPRKSSRRRRICRLSGRRTRAIGHVFHGGAGSGHRPRGRRRAGAGGYGGAAVIARDGLGAAPGRRVPASPHPLGPRRARCLRDSNRTRNRPASQCATILHPTTDAGVAGLLTIGLRARRIDDDLSFWVEGLGARVGDRVGDIAYLRLDAAHHRIALYPVGSRRTSICGLRREVARRSDAQRLQPSGPSSSSCSRAGLRDGVRTHVHPLYWPGRESFRVRVRRASRSRRHSAAPIRTFCDGVVLLG